MKVNKFFTLLTGGRISEFSCQLRSFLVPVLFILMAPSTCAPRTDYPVRTLPAEAIPRSVSTSAYALFPMTSEAIELRRARALAEARQRCLFFLVPQLCATCLRFDHHATSKKTTYFLDTTQAPLLDIEYLEEEPQPRRMVRLTARAERNKLLFESLAGREAVRIALDMSEERVLDDPGLLPERLLRLTYGTAIDTFAHRTFGEEIPRRLTGFIALANVHRFQETERCASLDAEIIVAFTP